MLDTIVITLTNGMYFIREPDMFEPSANYILGNSSSLGGRGYISAKQNPTKYELMRGIYKPRLTLTNRYNHSKKIREAALKIELSLPKLQFGNNFEELCQSDFYPVLDKLQKVLHTMGISVTSELLEKAPISAIHYSKNILLTDGTTPHYIIGKIKEANIKLSLDVSQTDYRNEGYSYKWHSNSYEVAFYDKLKDMETSLVSEKRAIENDNLIQLELFKPIQKSKRYEVLRMEVRLNRRQKIKQLLRMLGYTEELTFKYAFDASKSQQVLLHYISELESKRLPLFDYKPANPRALLAELLVQNPNLKLKRIIQIYGLKQIFDTVNPRELRTLFAGQSQRSWYRLIAEARVIKLPPSQNPLKLIRDNILTFAPLILVDFQDKMLNNVKYN